MNDVYLFELLNHAFALEAEWVDGMHKLFL